MQIEMWPVKRLIRYARNARTHSEDQVAQIAASIAEFGFNVPCLVDDRGVLIAGHGRLLAAKRLGLKKVPAIRLKHLTEAQARAFRIADNQIALNADWDDTLLAGELAALCADAFDLGVIGIGETELQRLLDGSAAPPGGKDAGENGVSLSPGSPASAPSATLAERFGIPPFSVFDARKGWWQERKRAWIDLGIRSELGRGAAPGGSPRPLDRARNEKAKASGAPGGSPLPAADYSKSKARGDGRGRPIGDG